MNARFIVASLALAVAAGANAYNPTPMADVPDRLAPDASESLAMVVTARGVQIYECRAAASPAGAYEWAAVAPEAELFDSHGRRVGKHYAGPRWESTDGSTIAGTVKERAAAPQAGAIPWLLLDARSVGPEGTFSRIKSVQRVNTLGGTAPQAPCSESAVGTIARMPYTADYRFFAETPAAGARRYGTATHAPASTYY